MSDTFKSTHLEVMGGVDAPVGLREPQPKFRFRLVRRDHLAVKIIKGQAVQGFCMPTTSCGSNIPTARKFYVMGHALP